MKRNNFLADGTIHFPMWVEPPSLCKTRTFSIVLTGTAHGAVRIEKAFANRPVRKLPRNGLPGYYIGWAPMDAIVCPITGYADCTERRCELHLWAAPIKTGK